MVMSQWPDTVKGAYIGFILLRGNLAPGSPLNGTNSPSISYLVETRIDSD